MFIFITGLICAALFTAACMIQIANESRRDRAQRRVGQRITAPMDGRGRRR